MPRDLKFQVTDKYSLILLPKQPYVDWLNLISEDISISTSGLKEFVKEFTRDKMQPSVYVFPETMTFDEIENELPQLACKLFVKELSIWTTDQVLLPRDITYELCCEWFDFQISLLIWNVIPAPFANVN